MIKRSNNTAIEKNPNQVNLLTEINNNNFFREIAFTEITSTQDYIRDNADTVVPKDEWVVVTANSQTKGRGTHNRRWASPPDVNIYATFALDLAPLIGQENPETKINELFNYPVIVQSATLAVAKTLENFGFSPTIKWRNDLLLRSKKSLWNTLRISYQPNWA